jgi:Aspartyl/Asparaginyl beta-hydroxylase
MRTELVATIPLDAARLAEDLEAAASFRHSETYSDYLLGGPWTNWVLWAAGGESGDGNLAKYAHDQPATFTEYGKQVPYLQELITNTVDLARLNFVRLAVISESIIVPHRDLLEFGDVPEEERPAHRLHIPLVTNETAFFSEDNTVYQMKKGEVWFLDVSRIHSVITLSRAPRFHLIFDFVDHPGSKPLVTIEPEGSGPGIPAERVVARPELPDSDRAGLMQLAGLLTMDNFGEVFGIVIKKHLRYDGGDDFVWDTMIALARGAKDPAVLQHALERHRYYTLERSA